MTRKRTRAREFVLQVMYQHEMSQEPIKDLFETLWEHASSVHEDIRLFAEQLTTQTLKFQKDVDESIRKAAENWDIERMAVLDRCILRFATYELLYRDDIPPKVTINEAVNIAKKYSQEESGKFVNGILDKIAHSQTPQKLKKSAGK